MLVTIAGFEILLDRSGVCVVPSHGLVAFNKIPWSLASNELFPEHGPTAQLREDIARICSEHRPKVALLLGAAAPFDPEGLESSLREVGLEPIWVGTDPATVPEGSTLYDEFEVDGLVVGNLLRKSPAIVGGFGPGDSGGKCFLLDGDRLILPDLSSLTVTVPVDTPDSCHAVWLGRNGLAKGSFEWMSHSLR